MKVLIQGKQLKVTDDLKRYVYGRLVEPLTRFYDDTAAELRVEFGDNNGPKGGNDKECHLTLRMPGTSSIQIEENTPDVYASLDAAADRLIRNCKKELDRLRTLAKQHHKYRPLGSVAAEGGVPTGPIEDLQRIKEHRAPPAQEAIREAAEEVARAEEEGESVEPSIGEAESTGRSNEV